MTRTTPWANDRNGRKAVTIWKVHDTMLGWPNRQGTLSIHCRKAQVARQPGHGGADAIVDLGKRKDFSCSFAVSSII